MHLRREPVPFSDLSTLRPLGFRTAVGWACEKPEDRGRCFMRELPDRLEGAANALMLASFDMEPSRASVVGFVYETLLDQVHVLRQIALLEKARIEAETRAFEEKIERQGEARRKRVERKTAKEAA